MACCASSTNLTLKSCFNIMKTAQNRYTFFLNCDLLEAKELILVAGVPSGLVALRVLDMYRALHSSTTFS
jgi:hypothetical protein